MKSYLLIIVALILSSCCKPIFETQTLYNNATNGKIEIRAFRNGVFNTSFIEARSTTLAQFVSLDQGLEVDSAMLFIDGIHYQTHYSSKVKKTYIDPKVLQFENTKNLLNFSNYQKSIEKLACDGSITKYIYTF